MLKDKIIFWVAIIWLAIVILLTPVVEYIMINSGTFVKRSIFPSYGYLLLSIILVAPILLLVEKAGKVFRRLIASFTFFFHSFPTLALLLQPSLYIMVFPVGIYGFLCSPLNPLFFKKLDGF